MTAIRHRPNVPAMTSPPDEPQHGAPDTTQDNSANRSGSRWQRGRFAAKVAWGYIAVVIATYLVTLNASTGFHVLVLLTAPLSLLYVGLASSLDDQLGPEWSLMVVLTAPIVCAVLQARVLHWVLRGERVR